MIGNKFLYFPTVASYEAALSEIQNTSIVIQLIFKREKVQL